MIKLEDNEHFEFQYIEALDSQVPTLWIDASIMKKSYCERAIYNTVVEHLRARVIGDHLLQGTAVHKFCELRANGKSKMDAQIIATNLAPEKMQAAVTRACMVAPELPPVAIMKNGAPFCEYVFKLPLYRVVFKPTRLAFNLALFGTFDRGYMRGAMFILQDFKTSNKWKREQIEAKYKYEWQMVFYKWILVEYGHLFFTMEMAAVFREFRLLSQIVAITMNEKTCEWIPLTQYDYSPEQHAEATRVITAKLWQILNVACYNLREKTGWATNNCQWCDYNILCHAPESSVDIVKAAAFVISKPDPTYGTGNAA